MEIPYLFLNKTKKGFTILEVLISLLILSFIAMIMYNASFQTYRLRDSLGKDSDFTTSTRIAFALIDRDLSLFYSPLAFVEKPAVTNLNPQGVYVPIKLTESYQADFMKVSEFWSQALTKEGVRPSRFQGSQKKLTFISNSHVRIYRDSLEGNLAKITYELKQDKSEDAFAPQMLVKTEDPAAYAPDDFKNPALKMQTILRGIEKIQFSYFQRDGKTWKKFNSWDSDKVENNYQPPDKIEVQVSIKGPGYLVYEAIHVFRCEIPLNGIPLQF